MLFTSAARALTRLFVLIVRDRLSTISRLISSSSSPNSSMAGRSLSGLVTWEKRVGALISGLNQAPSPSTGMHPPHGHERYQKGPEVHVRRSAVRRRRFSVREARQGSGIHPHADEEHAHREHPREE